MNDNINITNLILHILDNNHPEPIFSVNELEYERDIYEFIEKHLTKLFTDGDFKKAYFNPGGNIVFELCKELAQKTTPFVDVSMQLAQILFSIMKENPSIPPADVVFVLFKMNDEPYLAILKLNYKNSYIHYVVNTDDGNINQLIKQKTTLPNETQRVEEAVVVNLASLELKVLEKQYEVNGEKEFYLSKLYLKSDSELSNLQKLKILDKTVNKLSKKHNESQFDKVAKLRSCVFESIEEANEIHVEKVAEAVFGANHEVKKEYIEEIKKAGLVDEVVNISDTSTAGKKFKTQKLKTDHGIEINFPAHLYNNTNLIEFINNPDGTISILIKNVTKVTNK